MRVDEFTVAYIWRLTHYLESNDDGFHPIFTTFGAGV